MNIFSEIIKLPNYINNDYQITQPSYGILNIDTPAVTKRIQLGTEFSSYRNINGVYVYIYDKAKVTTYNDTDCCKIDSDLTLLGYELKFKTRTVLKLDATTDKGRKAKYYYDSHFKRYGRQINSDLITNGTNLTKYFIPLTYIDLQSVANGSNDDDRLVYSGISNKDAELELIISNTSGAYSTDCYLYVVLSYLEFFHLDPKYQQLRYATTTTPVDNNSGVATTTPVEQKIICIQRNAETKL